MQVIGTLELLAGQRIEKRLREAEHAERLQLARTAAGSETVQALAPLTRALACGLRMLARRLAAPVTMSTNGATCCEGVAGQCCSAVACDATCEEAACDVDTARCHCCGAARPSDEAASVSCVRFPASAIGAG